MKFILRRSLIKGIFLIFWTYFIVQLSFNVRIHDWKCSNLLKLDKNSSVKEYSEKILIKNEKQTNCSCKYPSDFNLDYNNINWQKYVSFNCTFYLYNAFYDNRQLNKTNQHEIRILSMIDCLSPPSNLICLIWFKGKSEPMKIQNVSYHYLWYSRWGNNRHGILQPYLINCHLNKDFHFQYQSISIDILNHDQCCSIFIRNRLTIIYNQIEKKKKKNDFAVCVKPLEYPSIDWSFRLIEWIELLKLLNVKKIFFYQFDIHPNMSQVLQYYQKDNFIEIKQHFLPGSNPNQLNIRQHFLQEKTTERRQNEIIPYNDCFYQNLYRFHYILLLDLDEIILPIQHENYSQMIQFIEKKHLMKRSNYAAFSARNVYFFDQYLHSISRNQSNIDRYFHMLTHIQRSSTYTRPGAYIKTFFKTNSIIALHNHFPLICFKRCRRYDIDISLGHLQHYRSDCVKELRKNCTNLFRKNLTEDFTIWKYRTKLFHQVTQRINQIFSIEFNRTFSIQ